MDGQKKHKKSKIEQTQVLFILIVYSLYLILTLLPFSREITINLSEFFYFVINVVVFSFIVKNNKKKLTALFLFIILALFGIYLLQIARLNNNEIFGSFWFGGALGHKITEVPFIASIFWTIAIFSSLSLSSKIVKAGILRIFLSSLFIVIFDFFLEPVAMKLNYWQWENKAVPVSNYIVWFITSTILAGTIMALKIEPRSQVSRSFFLIQTVFFIFLYIFL
jgi:putative membrane protein